LSDDGGFEGAAAGTRDAGIEDDVVTFAVAVGLGDAETEAGGLEGEGEFGEFSATLGGEFVLGEGGSSWARRWRASARRPDPGHAGKRKRRKPPGAAPLSSLYILIIAFWAGRSGHVFDFIRAYDSAGYEEFLKFRA
jgi:hypothetical protein